MEDRHADGAQRVRELLHVRGLAHAQILFQHHGVAPDVGIADGRHHAAEQRADAGEVDQRAEVRDAEGAARGAQFAVVASHRHGDGLRRQVPVAAVVEVLRGVARVQAQFVEDEAGGEGDRVRPR